MRVVLALVGLFHVVYGVMLGATGRFAPL